MESYCLNDTVPAPVPDIYRVTTPPAPDIYRATTPPVPDIYRELRVCGPPSTVPPSTSPSQSVRPRSLLPEQYPLFPDLCARHHSPVQDPPRRSEIWRHHQCQRWRHQIIWRHISDFCGFSAAWWCSLSLVMLWRLFILSRKSVTTATYGKMSAMSEFTRTCCRFWVWVWRLVWIRQLFSWELNTLKVGV